MSGLFNTFNVVKRGMAVHQAALNVTAHNVANADTEGYSVQRANIQTTQPFGMPSLNASSEPGQMGTGAEVASITRARDQFLDYQVRRENSTLSKYNAREEFLSEIESIFNEPSDTGISTSMTQFWDAWQQLSTNPESSTARSLVVSNAQALTQAINHNYNQLTDLQDNASSIIKQQTFDLSNMLSQIQDLNTQIKAVVIGGNTPNDLMDRRDLLLDKLSANMNVTIEKTDFEGVNVSTSIGGTKYTIINSDSGNNLNIAYVDSVNYYIDTTTPGSYDEKDIRVLSKDGNNDPVTIQYNGLNMGIFRASTGDINGIEINGVKLSGTGNTFTFGDGKDITTVDSHTLNVNGKMLTNTSGTWTYGGSAVNLDSNGNITDAVTGKVVLDGLKLNLDNSSTPASIKSFNYSGKEVTLNAAGDKGTLGVSSSQVSFDTSLSTNQIAIDAGGITLSDLDDSKVRAEVTLYMNGDVNQQLRIENIDVANTSFLNQFTNNHTVFFRTDKYTQELHGNATFNQMYDASKVKSFYFTDAGFESGSLNGYETVSDEIEKYKTQLNNLARSLAISVNTIHSEDGNGLDFFDNYAETSAEPAKVLSVNKSISDDASRINATKVGGKSGNGERALFIGQLRNTRMDILDMKSRDFFKNNVSLDLTNLTLKSSVSGTTLNNYFESTISDLGVSSQEAQKMVTNQESLLNQLQTRRDSVSGVSIDEEMTNMIQFQRAYQANAKMITVIDELLNTVVNGLINR